MALRSEGMDEAQAWAEDRELTLEVLDDSAEVVWDLYKESNARPQYIVFDREQVVVDRGSGADGHESTQQTVLELL